MEVELKNPDPKTATSIFDFKVLDIDGNEVSMCIYKGYVTYIVNVASAWGLTAVNYTQMAELHKSYSEKGLRILAFPCNQFGKQEPGTNAEVKKFAQDHRAEYDLFSKIDVNCSDAHPLYEYLKAKKPGIMGTKGIKWNFSKFLCGKDGVPVKRYGPKEDPFDAVKDIEAELCK